MLTVNNTALVFEGGAMRAVYSAALVEALIEADVDFRWVYGNSASTSHVAFYITKDVDRMRQTFTTFPSHPEFGGVRAWARGRGFFNAEFVFGRATEPDHPLNMDWDAFNNSPVNYRITGFNALTGHTEHWGREDIHSPKDFYLRARASSSLPFFMPPVWIDGAPWYDGAFGPTGGLPLDSPAVDGFDRVFVATTRTRDYRKAPGHIDYLVRKRFAAYPHLAESIITRHERYNQTKDHLFEMEREGRAYIFTPESITIGNGNRNRKRLEKAYSRGLEQARREMPAIVDFLRAGETNARAGETNSSETNAR